MSRVMIYSVLTRMFTPVSFPSQPQLNPDQVTPGGHSDSPAPKKSRTALEVHSKEGNWKRPC